MKIAIPVENGRLHSHFGGSRQFAVVEVDPNTKAAVRVETLPASEHQPGAFPRWLRELGVEAVINGWPASFSLMAGSVLLYNEAFVE